MASLSSTSSVSSSNSLGNTSLRGFGGMVSGIDRDSIIEAMTLGTQTKIANQQKQYTKLQWKQEAYRSISDQIIDWADKYASYSSTSSLMDASTFARNKITVHGKEESKQYVQVSGSSEFVDNVSITAVDQLATASIRKSQAHKGENGLQTGLTDLNNDTKFSYSNLEGATLTFGVQTEDTNGNVSYLYTTKFTFASSYTYKDEKGVEHTKRINYTPEDGDEAGLKELVNDLNGMMKAAELKVGDKGEALNEVVQFEYVEGKDGEGGKIRINMKNDDSENPIAITHYDASTLNILGYNIQDATKGITSDQLDAQKDSQKSFADAAISKKNVIDALTGQKLTFSYDGSKKDIELITKEEAEELKGLSEDQRLAKMAKKLQDRLNKAFGSGAVTVSTASGLSFDAKNSSTVSVTSNDSSLLKNLGLEYGSSNKVNLSSKLSQDALKHSLGDDISDYVKEGKLDLSINGVKIDGLTEDSSISDILAKINSTTDAGVKATYVQSEGRFMLVSSETGEGREITLDSELAQRLFGNKTDTVAYDAEEGWKDGQNAKVKISYGGGEEVLLERASNTFDLEGLSITVSGKFGGDGAAVTFSAKADVDGVTEKVKSFFEDFNALVTEINKQVTTRPDSSYEPLTDEQRDEMDETSIENWEKKAKEGLLFGDSTMRGLSSDIEMIFSKLLSSGASYEDLKEIGITYSEDYLDGGTLVFDENAFRSAMESDPEKVSNIFAGGGNVKKGLVEIIDDTFTPYATRYASKNAGDGGSGSYGQLIEIAGSEKKPTTLIKNQIYEQLKQMQETIDTLKERLETERDRYISQFTYMESMINQFNSQSGYLSQITG